MPDEIDTQKSSPEVLPTSKRKPGMTRRGFLISAGIALTSLAIPNWIRDLLEERDTDIKRQGFSKEKTFSNISITGNRVIDVDEEKRTVSLNKHVLLLLALEAADTAAETQHQIVLGRKTLKWLENNRVNIEIGPAGGEVGSSRFLSPEKSETSIATVHLEYPFVIGAATSFKTVPRSDKQIGHPITLFHELWHLAQYVSDPEWWNNLVLYKENLKGSSVKEFAKEATEVIAGVSAGTAVYQVSKERPVKERVIKGATAALATRGILDPIHRTKGKHPHTGLGKLQERFSNDPLIKELTIKTFEFD